MASALQRATRSPSFPIGSSTIKKWTIVHFFGDIVPIEMDAVLGEMDAVSIEMDAVPIFMDRNQIDRDSDASYLECGGIPSAFKFGSLSARTCEYESGGDGLPTPKGGRVVR